MQKKITVLAIATLLLLACGNKKTSTTADEGVVINGVCWATRNVDVPGTFAGAPESTGMYYNFNGNVGWSATNPLVATHLNDSSELWKWAAYEWETKSDPSPAGWRIPTKEELESLADTAKVSYHWVQTGGAYGVTFTDKATGNSIFLSANGMIEFQNDEDPAENSGYRDGVYDYIAYWSKNGDTVPNPVTNSHFDRYCSHIPPDICYEPGAYNRYAKYALFATEGSREFSKPTVDLCTDNQNMAFSIRSVKKIK